MKINASQIDSASLNLAIQQATSGSAFSGNFVAYVSNSGWLGNTVVYTTGGLQLIRGSKIFETSPTVPYSGGTGTAPSTRWVLDQVASYSGWANSTFIDSAGLTSASGQLSTNLFTTGSGLYTSIFNTGAALSRVSVTGGGLMQRADITGMGGTTVYSLGNQIIISGGAGGGGSSNTSVTGSAAISAPNFTGVGNVVVSYDGTYVLVSGTSSAAGVPNTVTTTGTYILAGGYTFSGSPFVPIPTQPSGAANILFVSGASGILSARDSAVSGVLYDQMTGISGAIVVGAQVTNNYFITGTGLVSVNSSASGSVNNTINITSGNVSVSNTGTTTNTINVTNGTLNNNFNLSGITGNFVNLSFYFDSSTLATGLNTLEAMVGRSFYFTGYGIGVINTGTQGFFSGSFYQRTQTNVKTNFVDFSLNSGTFFTGKGNFAQEITGLNRVGLDIYRIGTGITGLSIGLFGVGY